MSQDRFFQLLNEHVADARIRFHIDGRNFIVGAGCHGPSQDPCDIAIRVHRARFFSRVLSYGNLGMGEAYMDRDFEIEEGTLPDFLTILVRNRLHRKIKKNSRLIMKILGMRLVNALRGMQNNARRHYDLGNDLFEAFLDPTLSYTSGYAYSPEDDLEQMQLNKLDRICRKLSLQPGDRLLDIGCGFGGLLIYAAKNYGVVGAGLTISREEFERGNADIAGHGLADRVRIELKDQRAASHFTSCFDKVVSVGVMEHLPGREYAGFFRNIARALTPQGRGLVHTVACIIFESEHDPFTRKYIFPGSSLPKLSDIALHLERNHLAILDVENIIRHYACTARAWLQRFQANRRRLDPRKYDDAFMRMWEYYLSSSIAGSLAAEGALYQVLFTKDCAAPIPLQRV
jgi:cyclopropane-fatty-acyl-phospholipid synthase